MASALEMPTDNSKEMLVEYRKRIKNPVRPVLLATGTCKEVIHKGDDVPRQSSIAILVVI